MKCELCGREVTVLIYHEGKYKCERCIEIGVYEPERKEKKKKKHDDDDDFLERVIAATGAGFFA